jgi:hypothetical protein
VILLLRIGLGIFLLLAVAGKLRHFHAFRRSLEGYGLKAPVAWAGAPIVIALEAVAVALTLSAGAQRPLGLVATLLGGSFTVVQTYLLVAGNQAACLCFGTAAPVSTRSWASAAAVLASGIVLLIVP